MIDSYILFNFLRALFFVNCQVTVARRRFRFLDHAITSRVRIRICAMRRSRHCFKKNRQFYFGHIQPACFLWGKRSFQIVERAQTPPAHRKLHKTQLWVCVFKIILHQGNLLCFRIAQRQVSHEKSIVLLGFLLGNFNNTLLRPKVQRP